MKNLRLLSLAGLFVIFCTENVSSTSQPVQQPNEIVLQTGEPDQQPDALFVQQIINAALAEDITQIKQRLEANPDYSIDQQNQEGKTPLHALLDRDYVETPHIVALLKFNPTILTIASDRTTPLHAAAAIRGDQDILILKLLVTKILVDTMSHPFNPASSPAISSLPSNAYITNLDTRLSKIFESPINREKSAETLDLLRTRASTIAKASNIDNARKNIIWECTKLLKAYMYINDYRIDKESFGDFDIHLSFEEAMFKTIIDKDKRNLLQLAGDQQNTRLVSCICSRIYTPCTLRRLSRAPGTKWKDLMSDNLPYNDEIKRTIRTRYWSQLSDVLKTVGLVITGTIVAYLGFLIRQIHHQLSR